MYIAVAHNASTNHYISMTSQQQITTSQQTAAMSHFSAAMSQKSAVMSHFCLRCCCDVAQICCDVAFFCCDVAKICCDVAKNCCDVASVCCDVTASGCNIAANLLFVGATSQQKFKTMQFLHRKSCINFFQQRTSKILANFSRISGDAGRGEANQQIGMEKHSPTDPRHPRTHQHTHALTTTHPRHITDDHQPTQGAAHSLHQPSPYTSTTRLCQAVSGACLGVSGCVRLCQGRVWVCQAVSGACLGVSGCVRGVSGCVRLCQAVSGTKQQVSKRTPTVFEDLAGVTLAIHCLRSVLV